MRSKSKEVYFSELTQNLSNSVSRDRTKELMAQVRSNLLPILGILIMLLWIHLSLVNGKIFFGQVLPCAIIVIALCLLRLMDRNK